MAPHAKQPRLGSPSIEASKQDQRPFRYQGYDLRAKSNRTTPSGPMFRSLVGSVKKGLEPQACGGFRNFRVL